MPASERRQIENEMIFRRSNEQIGVELDEVDAFQVNDGYPHLIRKDDLLLEFLCECSDEHCSERLSLLLSVYQKLHLARDTFIVKPGHQVGSIEKVMARETTYVVVKKNKSTTEPGNKLNITSTK